MTNVRQPAVADTFYPDDPDRLRQMLQEYLDHPTSSEDTPRALIVPHAGYVYSGPVAGVGYAHLHPLRTKIRRVVLIGPAHRVPLQGLALPEADEFASPLGRVPVDARAAREILELPQVHVNAMAHALEHSLEVHLPFLQEVLEEFSIVPLVVGDAEPEEVCQVIESLWQDEETLIVVSSDLSHYHDYETARQLDQETSRAIEKLQIENLRPEQACGCIPIQGLLLAARQRGLQVVNVDLRSSGDTAGNRNQVVGYGAYVIF